MNEIWKDIDGLEGSYMVSSLGRVRSVQRVIARSGWRKQTVRDRILKPRACTDGYVHVCLNRGGRISNVKIHRLVALAFLPPDPDRLYINHIDGNKKNNRLDNLEWCTAHENISHAIQNNLYVPAHGTQMSRAKLTEESVAEVRAKYARGGTTQIALAHEYGVSQSTMRAVLHGQTWKHVA